MYKEIYIVTGYECYADEEHSHILCAFTTEKAAEEYISKYNSKSIYCCMTIEQVELYD